MKAPELLPCPFCGPQKDENLHPIITENECIIHKYVVGATAFCPSCGLSMHDEYTEDLITTWNTRPHAETQIAEAVAGAYEAAADFVMNGDYRGVEEAVLMIEKTAPADAQAALTARDARVREEALREAFKAAEDAYQSGDDDGLAGQVLDAVKRLIGDSE